MRQARSIVTIERVQVLGSKAVLRLTGRMDVESAASFEPACESCISEGFTILVIDVGGLTYISSNGLRSIISVAKKLTEKGGELRICGPTGLVRQVFEITKLSQVFPMHETVESALMDS